MAEQRGMKGYLSILSISFLLFNRKQGNDDKYNGSDLICDGTAEGFKYCFKQQA